VKNEKRPAGLVIVVTAMHFRVIEQKIKMTRHHRAEASVMGDERSECHLA
jgi:hypothetical protein